MVTLSFLIDPTPSVRTHLPSPQFAATVGLRCGSSPFKSAPCTINQTAQSYRLPPFHNYYQPCVQSAVWHNEYTCNTRAAQPIFYLANCESVNRSDNECKNRYEATTKRCQESQRSVTRGNENLKGMQRIPCRHTSLSEGSKYSNTTSFNKNWGKDRESSTMLPQKRKPLDSDSRASLKVPQPEKHFDEAHMLGSQQSEGSNKQLLNDWSGIQNSYRSEFGDVTHHVQTITSLRRENNNGDDIMRHRPGNSKLQPTSKILSDDATGVDTTVLLTIAFNQDKSSPELTCSAQHNNPTNSVYKDYLAENDWAGDSYNHNIPRIVAVHSIVKDRCEKTQRRELRGAEQLSSNEMKEWNHLLADLSSSSMDGYYEVENK